MATPVFMIFMNGADKSWKIVRPEAWNLLKGSIYSDIIDADIEAYYHPDDWEEFKETLRDRTLRENDVALYLPPMQIQGTSTEFFDVRSLMAFAETNNLAVMAEFTCYT